MSVNGRVNVDVLVHDSNANTFRVFDVESSTSVAAKAVLIIGTATEEGTVIDPAATGYLDASGVAVDFASVSTVVLKGGNSLTCEVGDVSFKTAANTCGLSATPGHAGEPVTVYGTGLFQLVLLGD